MSLVTDLLDGVDDILGIRDDLGAQLQDTYMVERTWSGSELGAGTASESKTQILPSPRIVDYSHDLRIKEGGAVQQGDIVLKMLSKHQFPAKSDVDCSTSAANVEKFYEVGGKLYRVISVTEKHLVWSVQLRPLSDQAR